MTCGSNTRSKNIALNGSVDDKSGRVRFVEIEAIDEAVAELGIFASYGFDRIEEKIAEIEGEELKAHKYAEFTWNALINKLNAAKAILKTNIMVVASDNVTVNKLTQAEVNKAYYDLVAARAGLVTINQMPIAIDNAIKEAEALFESDVVYTTASWNKFIAALNAVKKYQAVEDINKVDPVEIGNAITALTNAKNNLVKGGDIYTGADFAKLKDQEGVFNLMADITITEDVDSFKGVLKGNGHTITLDGCNLFDKLDGATVANLVVKGTANASVFGKAVNKVTLSFVYVDLDCGLDYAILFDECASAAEIKLTGVAVFADEATYAAIADVDCKIDMNIVVAGVDAPALTTSENVNYKGAYLVGVEGFGTGKELPLGDGSIAYSLNVAIRSFANNAGSGCLVDEFKALTLVQVLGDDAYPVVGPFAVDGTNVVAPVYANGAIVGYKNEAIKYEDETPVIPVEPIAPIAPVTSGLQESITEAEALVEANYTADTWTALKNALAAAKTALTADGQAAIDDAKYALDIAIIGLEKVAPAAPTPLALDALNAAIAAAEAKNAGEYTTGSWSAVKAALLAAKRAKLADQAAVDAATAALNAAVAALVEAPAPEAPVISKPETNAPATEEEGCGGIIGGAAVVLTAVVALGAGVSFKKKED